MARQKKELPTEFWTQPVSALGNEALQLIYAEVSTRLRRENPDADTLEMLLIERVAFLYVFIRNKESQETFGTDRTYKEMLQTWLGMAADLRKRRDRVSAQEDMENRIVTQVQLAVEAAIDSLDPMAAAKFQEKLVIALDQQGL